MKVLHVSQPIDGGVCAYVSRVALAQRRQGAEVVVACPSEGELPRRLRVAGIPQVPWQAVRHPGLSVVGEVASLRSVLRGVQPDVVHLHSAKAGLAGRLVPGRPVTVFQPHGWSWEAARGVMRRTAVRWERLAGPRADAIVCVGMGEKIAGQRAGIKGRWEIVVQGVDLDAFGFCTYGDKSIARAATGLPDAPTVACVGTLRPEAKGHDVLLHAWPHVTRQVPGARLVLVGDGPYRTELQRHADASVVFAGHQDDVRPWIAAADVVAVPSRRDASSLSMLEAMAIGRSVVATDVADSAQTLDGAGAVVPVEDAPSLAAALAARLQDLDLAALEGQKGRAIVERHHDFRSVPLRLLSLYRELSLQRVHA